MVSDRVRKASLQITPEQRLLVQLSLDKVFAATDSVGALFYAKLFEMEPDLRRFFKSDLQEVETKFLSTLQSVVDALDQAETAEPDLEFLGRRHAEWGVTPAHYATVRSALLWALERSIGATFTGEVHEAWGRVYDWMAAAMLRGAGDRA